MLLATAAGGSATIAAAAAAAAPRCSPLLLPPPPSEVVTATASDSRLHPSSLLHPELCGSEKSSELQSRSVYVNSSESREEWGKGREGSSTGLKIESVSENPQCVRSSTSESSVFIFHGWLTEAAGGSERSVSSPNAKGVSICLFVFFFSPPDFLSR